MSFSEIRRLLLLNSANLSEFIIYLQSLFNDIAEKDTNGIIGVSKIQLFNLLKIPLFITDKIFSAFNRGLFKETICEEDFIYSFTKLYFGNFNETAEIIFNIFDFDKDGLICRDDIKLLLSYLPQKREEKNNIDKTEYTFQIGLLEELDYILNLYFTDEDTINYEKFIKRVKVESYIFLQMLCYLYQRCPILTPDLNIEDIGKITSLHSLSNNGHTGILNTSSSENYNERLRSSSTINTNRKTSSSNYYNGQDIFLKVPSIGSRSQPSDNLLVRERIPKKNSKSICCNNYRKIMSKGSFDDKSSFPTPEITGFKGMIKVTSKMYSKYTTNAKCPFAKANNIRNDKIDNDCDKFNIENVNCKDSEVDVDKIKEAFDVDDCYNNDSVLNETSKLKTKTGGLKMKYNMEKGDIEVKVIDNKDCRDCKENKENRRSKERRMSKENKEYNLTIDIIVHPDTTDNLKYNEIKTSIRNSSKKLKKHYRSISLNNYYGKNLDKLNQRKANTLKNLILLKEPNKYKKEIHYEGLIIKLPSEKNPTYKEFWVKIIGFEIFYYEINNKEKVVCMHNLISSFVSDYEVYEYKDQDYYCIPVTLMNKTIPYYFKDSKSALEFLTSLRKSIGYENFFDNYEMIETIGKGNYSQVNLGKNIKTNEQVAIKIIQKKSIALDIIESVRNEIDILKFISHKNIIKCLDYFETNDYIFIILEYLEFGCLADYIVENDLSEKSVANITYQIADALNYLNRYGIIHRDIKLENVMISQIEPNLQVKLIDFGFSKVLAPKETLSDGLGTLAYVAPEIILREPYNKPIDIWSLGVLVYFIIFGKFPFDDQLDDEENIAMKIINEPLEFDSEISKKVSKNLLNFLNKCLKKDPEKRISACNILKHKWILEFKIKRDEL